MKHICKCTACFIVFEPYSFLEIIKSNIRLCLDAGFHVLIFNNDPDLLAYEFVSDELGFPRNNDISVFDSAINIGYAHAVTKCAELVTTSHMTLVDQDDLVFADFLKESQRTLSTLNDPDIAIGGDVRTVFSSERLMVGTNKSSVFLSTSRGIKRVWKLVRCFDDTLIYLTYPTKVFREMRVGTWEGGISHSLLFHYAISGYAAVYLPIPMREYLAKGQVYRRCCGQKYGWMLVLHARVLGLLSAASNSSGRERFAALAILITYCFWELLVKLSYRGLKVFFGSRFSKVANSRFRRFIRDERYLETPSASGLDNSHILGYLDDDWLL